MTRRSLAELSAFSSSKAACAVLRCLRGCGSGRLVETRNVELPSFLSRQGVAIGTASN